MTLFQTNAIAWSKWTSQFQARMPNTAPTIFQANTVMASLDCRTGWSGEPLSRYVGRRPSSHLHPGKFRRERRHGYDALRRF